MKKTVFLIAFLLIGGLIFAQDEIDALRFSDITYSGTARTNAMANAFGALGADISTASTNPAGIGVFKNGNATITPAFLTSFVDASYNGVLSPADKLSMLMSNMGVVFSIPGTTDIKAVNISMGYNRTSNFRRNFNISGVNNKGSLLDSYMLEANGSLPSEMNGYTTFRAWDTWMLDNIPGDTLSYTNALWWGLGAGETPVYGENQKKVQSVTGGAGEYFANFAINYKDFFFFGATLGMQSFYYNSFSTYTEDNFADNPDLSSFTFTQNIKDQGTGINLKLGFILKPTSFLRIGGAFHTPTYFNIKDVLSTTMYSYWNTADIDGNYNYSSGALDETNVFDYNLLTPSRLMGDLGFIIGDFAIIGINYEHLDYSTMRMSSSSYIFSSENQAIRDAYKSVNNYKAGVELHFGPLYLRGGYALLDSPYKTNDLNYSRSQISGGMGLKISNLFVDFAYVRDLSKYNTYLYNGYTDEPVPSIVQKDGVISVTIGSRF